MEGVLFYVYDQYSEDETGKLIKHAPKLRIIDDKSLPGASLATRRLQLKATGETLYPLNKAFFFLGDLIKAATPNTWFIDSKGKHFQYTKTSRAKLKCKKITKLFDIPTGGSIVEVEDVHRFKTLHTVEPKFKYAGILEQGHSLILYGVYEEPFTETWRMI